MIKRRNFIFQTREAFDKDWVEHIGARGEDLAKFNIGGAKFFQRHRKALAGIIGTAAYRKNSRQAANPTDKKRNVTRIFRRHQRVMANQNPARS